MGAARGLAQPSSLGGWQRRLHTCLSRTMFMGPRGGGCRQGREAETRLRKSIPFPWLLEEALFGFKADLEFPGGRGKQGEIDIEGFCFFFFLLVFFLQYKTTVENNFS